MKEQEKLANNPPAVSPATGPEASAAAWGNFADRLTGKDTPEGPPGMPPPPNHFGLPPAFAPPPGKSHFSVIKEENGLKSNGFSLQFDGFATHFDHYFFDRL